MIAMMTVSMSMHSAEKLDVFGANPGDSGDHLHLVDMLWLFSVFMVRSLIFSWVIRQAFF